MEPDIIYEIKRHKITEEASKRVSSVCASPKKSALSFFIGIFLTLIFPLYMNFAMEYIHQGSISGCFNYVKLYTGSAIFSTLVLYLIFMTLWLIFKKGFFACFWLFFICSALAITNYFKHTLTGDFVYPWDLINQTGNLGELFAFIRSGFPLKYVLCLCIGFTFALVSLFHKAQINLKPLYRLILSAMLILTLVLPFNTPEQTSKTLGLFKMSLTSTAAQETNHIVNGFSGGFIVNCLSMNVSKPQGYSPEAVEKITEEHKATPQAKDFSSPDIILVLSESFWDPRLLEGTEFSENPLKNFDEISKRENAYSGYMYQTAFGGGTVRTEFEVLTGLTSDALPAGAVPWQYVSGELPTYASNYHNIGYRTVFMHTFGSPFYMRKDTYPRLGFDELYFSEDLVEIDGVTPYIDGTYFSDHTFADYTKVLLEKSDEPCFLFGITMENHQPYENKYEKYEIEVTNPKLSKASLLPLKSYVTGIKHADSALKELTDYIDSREKDTILIFFGDHLPTLGADKLAYIESGFISKGEMTDEEWRAIMRTPFLIYSNFALKDSDIIKKGTGNEISSYNLLNVTADLIGAPKSSLMTFLTNYTKAIPYYNARLKLKTTKEQDKYINSHRILTYDAIKK